ncbi:alanyl-tRNA editing protein [Eubacterium xylanophilum]|uniref:alanyl-tRNA editing protein n=1 Tax=Eubacterium xylanophilum TaxID=39497 RepID=UPI0004BB3E6E|nr:alanyl-tRNA editing protein [Eubacterium xylanophilum]
MELLYESNSYLTEHESAVSECFTEGDKIIVSLEETIFFPEEGGQYADTGILRLEGLGKDIKVLDGFLRDGKVYHVVDEPVEVGLKVLEVLNWGKRYMRMQNHSGEHVLTGTIHNYFGYDNVGFHLSDEGPVTMDVSGVLTWDQIKDMERIANTIIQKNVPISCYYPSKSKLKNLEYRSKSGIEGDVRIVRIGEGDEVYDYCACCAPHVARTGEIGLVVVLSAVKYKGGMRLEILSGQRAVEYTRMQLDTLNDIAKYLTTSSDEVLNSIRNLQANMDRQKELIGELVWEKINSEIEKQIADGRPLLFLDYDINNIAMKNAYNKLSESFEGYVGVFVGDDNKGYRFNAGSRELDSRKLAGIMREELDAKGGGNEEMIQGRVDAPRSAILDLIDRSNSKEYNCI